MPWDFSTEPEFEEKLDWARSFVRDEIEPLETLELDHATYRRVAVPLQQEVRRHGLWAAHLEPHMGGQGYGQVKLGLLNEILGRCELAPFVFGCQAPDTGNAELLALAGTEEQKRRWLTPLLETEILSAFSMTEPGTGSDPRQFTTRADLVGDEWVINGHKWFVSNASRAAFHLLMAATEPDADALDKFSMLIVPTDTPGIEMRPIPVMPHPDPDSGTVFNHCEVWYRDVRIPRDSLLGDRGGAFVLAQKRLGPGRIHHAMRWLGVGRRAFDMMCERAVSRSVHGGPLSDKQTVQNWIADSAAEMEAARLLTLQAAWRIDQVGSSGARLDIAMIKYFGARVLLDVIDRAIQVHGSLGYSGDMPLEWMYRVSRAARIYDGPDEVHRATVARQILRRYTPRDVPSEHVPTRRAAAEERFASVVEALSATV
jgi:acyl-CoA dehydrogenase